MAMAMAAPASSENLSSAKPVLVRIKRKLLQTPLQSLCLEVSERPTKRFEADFLSFSLNDNDEQNSGKTVEAKTTRLLFHHLETITSLCTDETTRVNTLLSQLQNETCDRKHRRGIKSKDPGKCLATSRLARQALNQKARFEQVWRSRKGEKKTDIMSEVFRLYDIVRVDTDIEALERSYMEEQVRRRAEEEENELLQSFLPLFKEYLPNVAAEVESLPVAPKCDEVPVDEYVYDLYALYQHSEEDTVDMEDYPMIQVMDEEDLRWGLSSGSEYDSEDSNDENNPVNDYPEEESDSEISSVSDEGDMQRDSEVESKSNASAIEENHMGSDVSGEYNDYSFEEWDDDYWRDSVYVDSTEERE